VTEDAVNRAINKRVKTALNDIDQNREFSSSMALSSLLDAARHDKLVTGKN
jgi:ABC-type protease/lipase transport system fused ATPase/permease subunit